MNAIVNLRKRMRGFDDMISYYVVVVVWMIHQARILRCLLFLILGKSTSQVCQSPNNELHQTQPQAILFHNVSIDKITRMLGHPSNPQ